MRNIFKGFNGWVTMHKAEEEAVHSVDTAITVVFTLLIAMTFTILH